jgi:prevent-host-death family protein
VTEIINVHQAKTHLSKLLDKAHGGEEIVLSKAGKPYAKLVPLEKPKRKLGFIKGHLDDGFFDPLPEAELSVWEGQ